MNRLPIVWKRLVVSGETCDRCAGTRRELEAGIDRLAAALAPLGIEPVLEEQEIDEQAFRALPAESNRVWIGGRPLEDWLGARVGASPCCSVCGDAECRTLEYDGQRHETVPRELFVKAGLMAASQMVGAPSASSSPESACCDRRCGCGP